VYVANGAAVNQQVIVGDSNPIGKLYRPIKVNDQVARVHLVGADMKSVPVAD
jgi:hypothetical protein